MLSQEDIKALGSATHPDPFAVLGMHQTENGLQVAALLPSAEKVQVIEISSGRALATLEHVHHAGIFDGPVPRRRNSFPYRLRVTWDGRMHDVYDPYRFPPVLGELDVWLLAEGRHARPYQKLGSHELTLEGMRGTSFAVWAPNARRVSIVGDFNHWDE